MKRETHVLVPREPTDKMKIAAAVTVEVCRCDKCGESWEQGVSMRKADAIYRAMLLAVEGGGDA